MAARLDQVIVGTDAGMPEKTALLMTEFSDHQVTFQEGLIDFKVIPYSGDVLFLPGAVEKIRPNVVIIDCESLSEAVLQSVGELKARFSLAVIVFVSSGDVETVQSAVRAGAESCVVDGLLPHRISPLVAVALERYRISSEVQAELQRTRESLESRKTIDRAKGILMDQRSLKEAEAYRLLRESAMSQNKTIREVAESIITASGFISATPL